MLSSIEINYLSYRVVPLIQNGNSFAIQNKPTKVEPTSSISTDLGYNSNNPNNQKNMNNMNNQNNSHKVKSLNFKEIYIKELEKTKGL